MALACGTAVAVTLSETVSASDAELHPANYPWSHNGHLSTLDHARFVLNMTGRESCDVITAKRGVC